MKKRPETWLERFSASLEARPSPALQGWRWAREGEEPVDLRAVDAAWDLVTRAASAEANLMNHVIKELDGELARTFFPALVLVCARMVEPGTLKVVPKTGRAWYPGDLDFIPGREHLPAALTIECGVEAGRTEIDFRLTYQHVSEVAPADETEDRPSLGDASAELIDLSHTAPKLPAAGPTITPTTPQATQPTNQLHERKTAILLEEVVAPSKRFDRRARDVELSAEGYIVARFDRAEVWQDAILCAERAVQPLIDSVHFQANR